MTTSGIVWQRRPVAIADDIQRYADQVTAATERAAARLAELLEADARRSAPWSDQTGHARRELFAIAETVAGELVAIILSHGPGVDYGVYLETRFGERYAVIWPTLSRHLDTIWTLISQELAHAR